MEAFVRRERMDLPGACLVSASAALQADLCRHCGTAFTFSVLHPRELLEGDPEGLGAVLPSVVMVLVDWCDHTVPVIPVARRLAGPFRIPIFALCGPARADHVAALVVGADGTLERPVRPLLLEARLLAHQRLVGVPAAGDGARAAGGGPLVPDPGGQAVEACCRVGPLTLDRIARAVRAHDDELRLTPKEFDLLAYLMTHAGRCRTRDEILDHAWGIHFDTGTNILDVHVYELRKKLRRKGLDRMLETVRGMGFRLVPPGGAGAAMPT